jgi:lysophospholipase L1-like esterase
MSPGLRAKLLLLLASPLVLIGGAEIALRAGGYRAASPLQLSFSSGDPIAGASEIDPDLIWRLVPDRTFRVYDFEFETNRFGTRDPAPSESKSAEAYRVVCLGDSTAFGNFTSYPAELAKILSAALPDRRVQVLNAGIPGYSARQGLELLRRDLLALQPDLVTWCFGFNNAKDGMGGESDDTIVRRAQSPRSQFRRLLMSSRFCEWVAEFVTATREPSEGFTAGASVPRVSPEEHGRWLAEASALCATAGVSLVAITQPHAFVPHRIDTLPLADRSFMALVGEKLDAQNRAVAIAAAEHAIPILDLQAEFLKLESRQLFIDPLPGGDSIHGNPLGLRVFATHLAHFLAAQRRLPRDAKLDPAIAALPAIGMPSLAACDLDSDGREEIVLASAGGERTTIVAFDPDTAQIATIPSELPRPERRVHVVQLSLLEHEVLVSVALDASRNFLASLQRDGRPGILSPRVVELGNGLELARVTPYGTVDRSVFVVDFGPHASDQYVLLGPDGTPRGRFPIPFDREQGVSFATGANENGDRPLWIAGRTDDAALASLLPGQRPKIARALRHGTRGTPVTAVPLHRGGEPAWIATLQGTVLAIEDRLAGTPRPRIEFPFGAALFDPQRLSPAVATMEDADGRDVVLLASATQESLVIVRLAEGATMPFAEVSLLLPE